MKKKSSLDKNTKNKPDIIKELAKKTGLTFKLSELYINKIINEMQKAFSKNKRIEIRGFGAFNVKTIKASQGRNPRTQESLFIPKKKKLSFKSYLLK